MSQKIIELIRSEDSATAVSAVQKTLGQKLLRAISEQATTVAKMTYGTIFEHFGGADEQPQFMNPADNAYAIFFANALKKFGVNGPEDFQDENIKAQFFQYVDNNWKAQDSVQGLSAPAGPMMGQTTGTMVPANATPPMPPTTPAEPVMPGIGAPTNTAPMPPDAMGQDAMGQDDMGQDEMPPDASAMPAPAANPGGFQIPPGYTLILHPADQPLPFGGSNDRSVASMSPTGAPATGDGEMDDSGSDPGLDALQAGQTGQNPDDGDDDEDPNLDITDDDMADADSDEDAPSFESGDDEEGAPPSFGNNNQFGDNVNHFGNNDQDDGDEDGIPNSEDQDDESVDFDGDGVPDSEDADDDGDGFEDGDGDEDGDGVPDGEDLDADGNGMYDDEEDEDGDGVPDRSDADKDGNNVLDADEEDEDGEDEDEDVDTDDDGNQFVDDAGVPDGDGDADDMDDSAADEDMDSDEDTSGDEEDSDDESDPDLDVTDKDVADLEDAEDDEDGDEDDEDEDGDDEDEDGEPSGEDEFNADVDSDDNFFKESYVIPKPKASKIVNNFPRTEDFGVTVANTEDILFIKECIDPLLAKTPKTDRAGQMKLRNVKKQLRDIRESRTEKLAALRKERAAIMRDLTKTLVEKEEAKFQLARQAKEHMRQCKNQATRVKKQYTGR